MTSGDFRTFCLRRSLRIPLPGRSRSAWRLSAAQTAIFGIVILGEPIGWLAAIAILISLVGVMALAVARSDARRAHPLRDLTSVPALLGIGSGAGFAVAAVCFAPPPFRSRGPLS